LFDFERQPLPGSRRVDQGGLHSQIRGALRRLIDLLQDADWTLVEEIENRLILHFKKAKQVIATALQANEVDEQSAKGDRHTAAGYVACGGSMALGSAMSRRISPSVGACGLRFALSLAQSRVSPCLHHRHRAHITSKSHGRI
jgi:hypothetical protein